MIIIIAATHQCRAWHSCTAWRRDGLLRPPGALLLLLTDSAAERLLYRVHSAAAFCRPFAVREADATLAPGAQLGA